MSCICFFIINPQVSSYTLEQHDIFFWKHSRVKIEEFLTRCNQIKIGRCGIEVLPTFRGNSIVFLNDVIISYGNDFAHTIEWAACDDDSSLNHHLSWKVSIQLDFLCIFSNSNECTSMMLIVCQTPDSLSQSSVYDTVRILVPVVV